MPARWYTNFHDGRDNEEDDMSKYCENESCPIESFSPRKLVIWSILISGLIVIPKMIDEVTVAIGMSQWSMHAIGGIVVWTIVWVVSAAMVVHERTNSFMTLLLSSLGAPGLVVGLFTLFAR